MFQFRAFPSYSYFIHCTILEYCSSVLPHSDISGSSLICSSPKLFAACRVLHRLLMPRHSPCALISLTCRRNKLHSSLPALRRASIHSVSFSSPNQSLRFDSVGETPASVPTPYRLAYKLVLLNYAGSTEVVYKIVFTLFLKK